MNRLQRKFSALLLVFTLCFFGSLYARDWEKYPPWIEVAHAQRVGAIGDIHGAFHELVASLKVLGFARLKPYQEFSLEWTGGQDILVFVGDYTDRGLYTCEVFEAIMDLEKQAEAAGGKVISLFGNHEALLLNGTVQKWANTLKPPKKQHYQNTIDSFERNGYDFKQAISPEGKIGAWIRCRPLFAIINGFLFVHAGLPDPPISRSDLAADYREEVEAEGWHKGLFMDEHSPLWNRKWWDDKKLIKKNLKLFGARGVIFGHTVGALGEDGEICHQDEMLISIDIGMTPVYGKSNGGGLLMTARREGAIVFRARYPDRPEKILFQCPSRSARKQAINFYRRIPQETFAR